MGNKTKSFTIGFLIGGIAAGAYTLLNTPKSGKQLRFDARRSAENWKEQLEEIKHEARELAQQIQHTSKESMQSIKDVAAELQVSVEEWRQSVAPHQKKIQKELAAIEKSMKELEEMSQPPSSQPYS
ncbi:YtxH domain-containing protein [Bacillaceae bacterium SIJ1]|uniref:YtxH domain-containing protein n=1 Tax=Litoribacterium kuwaitense TaxID=1398745 RepID=UPI0013EB3C79|nr:YtxH domain-containing protein [Litoribacterium kuwaitense]NGP43910.1 YtxH domain-containing protein [Litoribacterium kuwaitense]